jgi:hypothetical protein
VTAARRWPLPSWVDVLLVVAVALAVRLVFAASAPPFLNADSEGYFLPARDLVAGEGFDLGLRRTPTYPLFIAAVVALFGEDLQTLVTVQHLVFGPALATLAYVLGRLLTRRVVALSAALLTAISGPILLYEHYVMTEAPFAVLLVAMLVAVVLSAQRASWRWAATAGLLFGLLILCRPVAQVLAPLLGGALLLGGGSLRQRVASTALLVAAAGLVVVPWMAYNYSRHETFAVAGSGRFLLARTLKEDPGGYTFEKPPGLVEDPVRSAARRIAQQEAARRPPGSVAQRLREELGLTETQAYPIMFDLALGAIRNRPAYYLESSGRFGLDILVGRPIVLRREGLEWGEVDWERRARPVLQRPIYRLDEGRAQPLVSAYDPARYGPLVPALFATGLIAAALGLASRWLLLPGLAAVVLIGASAALVGPELRYRYPQDSLIALLAVQAIATGVGLVGARLHRAGVREPAGLEGAV